MGRPLESLSKNQTKIFRAAVRSTLDPRDTKKYPHFSPHVHVDGRLVTYAVIEDTAPPDYPFKHRKGWMKVEMRHGRRLTRYTAHEIAVRMAAAGVPIGRSKLVGIPELTQLRERPYLLLPTGQADALTASIADLLRDSGVISAENKLAEITNTIIGYLKPYEALWSARILPTPRSPDEAGSSHPFRFIEKWAIGAQVESVIGPLKSLCDGRTLIVNGFVARPRYQRQVLREFRRRATRPLASGDPQAESTNVESTNV